MESSVAHMSKDSSASFKGPFSFKDREAFPISVRISNLNKLFETALLDQEAIRVEMVQLVAESRALKAPVVLRTKVGGGGVHPPYQLAEPRSRREQVVKLIWIGRAAGKQVKSDPMPFVADCTTLTEHCARFGAQHAHAGGLVPLHDRAGNHQRTTSTSGGIQPLRSLTRFHRGQWHGCFTHLSGKTNEKPHFVFLFSHADLCAHRGPSGQHQKAQKRG